MDVPPPRPQPGLLRDLLLILGVPGLAFLALLFWWRPWQAYHVPADTDVFTVAAGVWDWAASETFCDSSGHAITFSADRARMVITQLGAAADSLAAADRVAEYDLYAHSGRHVRGRIRGEARLTDDGEPVVWDLVLASANEYRWQRTDWSGGYTPVVRRCPPLAAINRHASGDG
jgi:hypothetical protein